MLLGNAALSGLLIDIALFIVVFGILIFEIAARSKTRKKMAEIEQEIAILDRFQSDISANFEEEVTLLKEMLIEKTTPLTHKLNELSKKARMMHERNEAIRRELERKVGPLRASIEENAAKFSSSHDAIRKIVQQGKNEIDMITRDINNFAHEIQSMKDFIRERIIDLEL